MDRYDPVTACLDRLEADHRRMKRIGASTLALLALVLSAGMAWQQDPETVAVQKLVRTGRLELTDAAGRVVAVLAAADQDEDIVTTYHESGVKARRVRVEDNQFEGRYEAWDGLGLKTEEGDYRDGLRHGLWRYWRTSWGTSFVRRQGAWADGLRTGIWTTWHSTAQKASEGEYVLDAMAGNWKFWNEDGSVDEEQTGLYLNGEKIR